MMPVRRNSRRYLRIRVDGQCAVTGKEVQDAVQRGTLTAYGVHGLSTIEPVLIDFDEEERAGTIRCNSAGLIKMRSALSLITSVSDNPSAIRVDKVSGTLKGLRSK